MGDLVAEILFTTLLGISAYALSLSSAAREIKPWFWLALLVKLLASAFFIYLYLYYFGIGDVLSYHRQAIRLNEIGRMDWQLYLDLLANYDVLPTEPLPAGLKYWGNPSSWQMVKLVALVHLFTAENIWLTSMSFGLFSFWGMWRLYSAIHTAGAKLNYAVFLSLFMLPTVVFWTSSISKETLFWGGLGLLLSSLVNIWFRNRHHLIIEILIGISGLALAWEMRYFVVGVLLGCLLAWFITHSYFAAKATRPGFAQQLAVFGFVLSLGLVVAPILHPNFSKNELTRVIALNNREMQALAQPSDRIEYKLKANLRSMLTNSPRAFTAALFRPWLWEADDALKLLVALENSALIVIVMLKFFWWKKIKYPYQMNRLLHVALWVFVLVTAVFIGLATPVFGTLSRYKSAYLPFFVFLVLSAPPFKHYIGRCLSLLNRKYSALR